MVPKGKQGWNFTKDREIHVESNVWSTAQRQEKIHRCLCLFLMFMLGLSETIDQSVMASSVRSCGH